MSAHSPSTELAAAEPSALASHAAFPEARDSAAGSLVHVKHPQRLALDVGRGGGIALIIAVATAIRRLALAAARSMLAASAFVVGGSF